MNLEILDYDAEKTYEILKRVNVIYLSNKTQCLTLVGWDVIPLLHDETRTILAYYKNYVFRYKKGGCPDCEEQRMNFLQIEYSKYLDKLKMKYFGG